MDKFARRVHKCNQKNIIQHVPTHRDRQTQIKIGVLIIATNKYIEFIWKLYESIKKFFLINHDVKVFIFTNMPEVPNGAIRIQHEHVPWPGPALYKHDCYIRNQNSFSDMDYIYCIDADMLIVDTIGNEILGNLVGTIHPCFYNKPRSQFTYENRLESQCYIGPNEGLYYFAGAFCGGSRKTFLLMAETCKKMINIDLKNGISPVWQDESADNRYFIDNQPDVILTPSYCHHGLIPFTKKIITVDKDHAKMRA